MPTQSEWLAIAFLLYLLVPVALYLVGAGLVWLYRKIFRRGAPPAESAGDA